MGRVVRVQQKKCENIFKKLLTSIPVLKYTIDSSKGTNKSSSGGQTNEGSCNKFTM